MEVKAKARYVRMSPRKVRLVVDLVRGMSVEQAQTQLKFMNKLAATPVLKLLNSAAANAQNNFGLDVNKLYIKTIVADGGPTLKRFKPRAMGRATPIRKRTSHISIILEEKGVTKKVAKVQSDKVIQEGRGTGGEGREEGKKKVINEKTKA